MYFAEFHGVVSLCSALGVQMAWMGHLVLRGFFFVALAFHKLVGGGNFSAWTMGGHFA